MSRLMSVSLTESAVRDASKTVTRRTGWLRLRVGDRLTLCRKVMGLRRGEHPVRIVEVEIVAVSRERLDTITVDEVRREGFPDMTPAEFVEFFCRTHRGCRPDSIVTRIEWTYLPEQTESETATAPAEPDLRPGEPRADAPAPTPVSPSGGTPTREEVT